MKIFFASEKAVEFYEEICKINFPYHLKDQILRASSSVVLNLSEGAARFSKKEHSPEGSTF